MKNYFFILFILLLFSCKENSNTDSTNHNSEVSNEKPLSMQGAWELISYFNYRSDGSIDTIKSSNTLKQIKMYSPTKVMWSRLRVSDSLDWFGYGDYTANDSVLTEVLDYGSKAMNNIIKENKEFTFKLILEENKFSQISLDEQGNPMFAENYKRIE
ncbi:hypothetical protein [Aestuariivivens sp. NBU2969]|uniref:hypothetical protein n=1 Tax=Aestuariivivens sp. NBU2969 TaxID=2873267 RepID=UPI001CBC8F7C|nr:hypothetical protein [Aestuariivivens sp. NBU2969]